MEETLIKIDIAQIWAASLAWLEANVLVTANAVQIGIILTALAVARFVGPRLGEWLRGQGARRRAAANAVLVRLARLTLPISWLGLLWLGVIVADNARWPHHLLQVAASLTSAWVVIRIASGMIRNPAWSRFIAWTAWTLAALSTLGLYEATMSMLDSLAISFGEVRISVLMVTKGVVALAILLWVAIGASGLLETRINRAPNLTPSLQVLIGKLVKIVLVSIAILVALDSIGIDLTALAVFGGALGVGIGLGLQRIVANLISGLILLMDRSIKPGDVITVGQTFGWIVSLGARYAAVRTRDGTEHLIPNEELITQRVENWSHSDRVVRLRIPIGVHYQADVRLAIKLCLEAAAAVPRVLTDPESRCLLRGFGDSSVDLELRIWINDPTNGRSNVISEVLLVVWDKFHEYGIEIPYPQRDLHLRSSAIPIAAASA